MMTDILGITLLGTAIANSTSSLEDGVESNHRQLHRGRSWRCGNQQVYDRMLLRRRIHDCVSAENPYQRAAKYAAKAAIKYIKRAAIEWIGATL